MLIRTLSVIAMVILTCVGGKAQEVTIRIYSESDLQEIAHELSNVIASESGSRVVGMVDAAFRGAELIDYVRLGQADIVVVRPIAPLISVSQSEAFLFNGLDDFVASVSAFTPTKTNFGFSISGIVPLDTMMFVSDREIDLERLDESKIFTFNPSIFRHFDSLERNVEIYDGQIVDALRSGWNTVGEVSLSGLTRGQSYAHTSSVPHRFLVALVLTSDRTLESLDPEIRDIVVNAITRLSMQYVEDFPSRVLDYSRDENWSEYRWYNRHDRGPDCTSDEYKKREKNRCVCVTGNNSDEC